MNKILVIRNDKIGDFVQCFPAFACLKQSLPQAQIIALVPEYTAPLANLCPFIDEIIIEKDYENTLQEIKTAQFDAVICFVSTWQNAKLCYQAKINYRLAPATKIFQFLFNKRLKQRRSQSAQAEWQYNLDLVKFFLNQQKQPCIEIKPPFLNFSKQEIQKHKEELAQNLNLNLNKKWLFVHSNTGGSANNLSLKQYQKLLTEIYNNQLCEIVLTAGKNDVEQVNKLSKLLKIPHKIYQSTKGLDDFTYKISCADLFIAGSTGPLHLAGAVNIATIGFYPSRRSALPKRWQPINEIEKHLAFAPPIDKKSQMDLTKININQALIEVMPFINKNWND